MNNSIFDGFSLSSFNYDSADCYKEAKRIVVSKAGKTILFFFILKFHSLNFFIIYNRILYY